MLVNGLRLRMLLPPPPPGTLLGIVEEPPPPMIRARVAFAVAWLPIAGTPF
jgi:hypothetical protein